MRRLERGASYVPLIVVVVLLIVAIVWAYVKTDEADKLAKDLATAKATAESETSRRSEMVLYIDELSDLLGFPLTEPTEKKKQEYRIDIDKVRNHITEKLEELKELKRTFPANVYTFTEGGGISTAEGDQVTVRYLELASIPSEATVEQLYGLMASSMRRMLVDIDGMFKAVKDEKSRYAQYEAGHKETVAAKDAEIQTLREEKNSLQASLIQKESELKSQISGLEDRNKALEVQLDDVRNEMRTKLTAAGNTISALKQNIVKLKKKKDFREKPIGPDGQILSVTEGQGLAVIDRGKAHHLQAGLTFDVYTLGKGAQKVYKGSVIVLDVGNTTSKVRVLALRNPLMPMVKGDYLESLTYNPAEQLSFVLIGRFKKYGRSDAAKRIQQLGQIVENAVTIDTDYLVMGAPESEDQSLEDTAAYKKAKELGVKIITEDQLSSFLQY